MRFTGNLLLAAALFIETVFVLYAIWHRLHASRDNAVGSIAEPDRKKKGKDDPDYCKLNEIMGYEFIKIQHVVRSDEQTEEVDPEGGSMASSFFDTESSTITRNLGLTDGHDEDDVRGQYENPAVSPVARPVARSRKEDETETRPDVHEPVKSPEIENASPSAGEPHKEKRTGKEMADVSVISESEVLAYTASEPWPDNDADYVAYSDEYMDSLFSSERFKNSCEGYSNGEEVPEGTALDESEDLSSMEPYQDNLEDIVSMLGESDLQYKIDKDRIDQSIDEHLSALRRESEEGD